MKLHSMNDTDHVIITEDTIRSFAGAAAVECFGIVGMASVSMKDGLVKMLRRESQQKGIQLTRGEDDSICLEMHIIVAYGVNITAVCENLIETVKYRLEQFSGLKVADIDVFVEGVRPVD